VYASLCYADGVPIEEAPAVEVAPVSAAQLLRIPPAYIEQVFDAWKQAAGHPRAQLTQARQALIARAIADFGVNGACEAVQGWRYDAFYNGQRGRVRNQLGLLLRDAQHIERFRDLYRRHLVPSSQPAPPPPGPPAVRVDWPAPDDV